MVDPTIAVAYGVLVTLDVLAIGIGVANARQLGHDEAARTAASAAHSRLDDLLGIERYADLDELVDDERGPS